MKQMILTLVIASIGIAIVFFITQSQSTGFRNISALDAAALVERDSNIVVLDVRTPEEYRSETGHLPHAVLIPVQELEYRADELETARNKTILVYCRSGRRSIHASEIISKKGFTAINLEGGILQWLKDSLIVVKEK